MDKPQALRPLATPRDPALIVDRVAADGIDEILRAEDVAAQIDERRVGDADRIGQPAPPIDIG